MMVEFVADITSNHNCDLVRCQRLIREAARVGCTGVKFPLFRIEQLYAPQVLRVSAKHRLRRREELPLSFVPKLSRFARDLGLKFGLTVFDLNTVDEVQTHVDFLAISSYELPWLDLIDKCADTGLPLQINTAMADATEAWDAIQTALEAGCTDLTMLHGMAIYPAPEESCNLAAIGTIREVLVREFEPMYGDAALKAGWSDHSVSAGVIARAVNHWACEVIEFHLDLEGCGDSFHPSHCWLPDRIAEVIAGGYLPVRRESDGTGRIAPGPGETAERPWRAAANDGLRPIMEMRQSWPQTQPESEREGPDVYLVLDSTDLKGFRRCLALAENLRDDHDADLLFLIRGIPAQIKLLERHGFNWTKFEELLSVASQIVFLDTITANKGPAVCVLDIAAPADDLCALLRDKEIVTVVIDQPECENTDLGIIPALGWTNPTDRPELVGGSKFMMIRDDVSFLRSRLSAAGPTDQFPRILICFGGGSSHSLTTRTVASLHAILPRGQVQVVLDPTVQSNDLTAQILESRFPKYEIIIADGRLKILLASTDVIITDMSGPLAEAIFLGIPGVVLAQYPSDMTALHRLAESGAVVSLGFHDGVSDGELVASMRRVFEDADCLSKLRFHAEELAKGSVDGHGASRVADLIAELVKSRGEPDQ